MIMASGARSINSGSDELFQNDCDVCLSQSITSEATSYCTICCEHLCTRCEQSHRGSRATRDHTIVTGAAIPSGSTIATPTLSLMFCDTHKSSILDIYCTTHDEVVCILCQMAKHPKCSTMNVSRHVTKIDVATMFREVVQGLADLTDKFDNIKKSRQSDKVSLKANIQACYQDIFLIRKKIDDKMNCLEEKMSAEIRAIEDKLSKEIDNHDAIAKDILLQIDDLNKSMNDCQNAQDACVTFVGARKASAHKKEFEKIITNIQEDICPINIRLQPNSVLNDMMDQIDSLGTLVTDKHNKHNNPLPVSVLNMSVLHQQEIDVRSACMTGCVFMPDGHLIVRCAGDSLNVFDEDFRFKSQLSVRSSDVVAINDTDVIVTQGEFKKLQIVRVLPNMEVKRTLKTDRTCSGVDVFGDRMYVTCHDNPGNGEVQILNMDGKLLRRLGVNGDNYLFTWPIRLQVNGNGSKLFISDWNTNSVTCMDTEGHVIYEYSGTDLQKPQGMCVDQDDNMLVCGDASHNVHVVRHDGSKEKILLSPKDGIQYPIGISYRQKDGCLVVVLGGMVLNRKLIAFTTKTK